METGPRNETERLDVLQRLRNKGARKRSEREVVLGTLLKLLVKDKLLHNGKVPVNPELRPLRRNDSENGSSAIRHFERGNEDVTKDDTSSMM